MFLYLFLQLTYLFSPHHAYRLAPEQVVDEFGDE